MPKLQISALTSASLGMALRSQEERLTAVIPQDPKERPLPAGLAG